MALTDYSHMDKVLLDRNIETLREDRYALTSKLNFVRGAASKSNSHLSTFNDLENRLIDLTRQVHHLETQSRSNDKGAEEGGEIGDGGSEQVRNDLKTSMGLTSASDILSEDITRFKVGLEQTEKVDAKVSESGQLASVQIANQPAALNVVATPEPEDELATAKTRTSPRLKTKKQLQAFSPKIMKEAKVVKKMQNIQWAPVGY